MLKISSLVLVYQDFQFNSIQICRSNIKTCYFRLDSNYNKKHALHQIKNL